MDEEPGLASTVWRDLSLILAGLFIVAVIMLLPFINDPTQRANADQNVRESVIVELTWPEGWDTDVDLWVKAPGDKPVGYSNLSGLIFNLLRDDLGTWADPMPANYELSVSRGIPPGEWVVNAHLYHNNRGEIPVPIKATVRCKTADGKMEAILTGDAELYVPGEEITLFRFELDDCAIREGSVTNLLKPLRSGFK